MKHGTPRAIVTLATSRTASLAAFLISSLAVSVAVIACSPKSQTTPSEDPVADSGAARPPACDDDHPCPAGQICKRRQGAAASACLRTCGDGRDAPALGDTFPASDGCNSCTCTDTGASCTAKACECNPGREQNRQYNLKDANECKAAFFQCAPGSKPFFNTCGCGCEQPPSCPPTFNCMPGPGAAPCNAEEIKKTCPLSTVAY